MIKLTPNLFLEELINIYNKNAINKYVEILKKIKMNNYNLKIYNELREQIKKQYENKYELSDFNIIFESFFPIQKKYIDSSLFMSEKIMDQMKSKKNNLLLKYKNTLNQENFDLNFFDQIFDFKNINIKIFNQKSIIFIEFINSSNHKNIKYKWGPIDKFKTLLNLSNIQINIENEFNIDLMNNIDLDENHNLTKELNENKENIIILLKNLIDNNVLSYSKESYILNQNNFKDLFNYFKNLYNILNESSILNKKQIDKIKNEIFNNKFFYLLKNYIYDYINQYIFMERDDIYTYFIKINKIYQELSFFLNIKYYSTFLNTNQYNFFGILGKKLKNHSNINLIKYIVQFLELYLILFKIFMFRILKKQDLLLSILIHQYDFTIFKENKYYLFRNDIESFYKNKKLFIQYLNKKEDDYIVFYEEPFLFKSGLFINLKYELNFPYDIFYQLMSCCVEEDEYSDKEKLNYFLNTLSVNKKYQILNHTYSNFYNIFNINNNFNLEKIKNQLKKINHKNLINSNQTHNSSTFNYDIKYLNQFYQIYEENFLEPLKDDISMNNFSLSLKNNTKNNFKPTKYAYCSLFYGNNQYFLDALTFGYSLYKSGTPYDRILLCTKDVLYEQKQQLSRFYNRIFVINELEIDPKLFLTKNRWYGVFNKLYAFYLDEYEKIILTDTDMLIQKTKYPIKFNKYPSYCKLDLLFDDVEAPAGMCYDKDYILKINTKVPVELIDKYANKNLSTISAGILLIKPSKKTFYDMIIKVNPNTSTDFIKKPCRFPEEGFLCQYFKENWKTIPVYYNYAPIWMSSDFKDFKNIKNIIQNIPKEKIVVIHYGGYKPWQYLSEPQWYILDNLLSNKLIMNLKMLWCKEFFELEKLCDLPLHSLNIKQVPNIKNLCNWEPISFK